MAATPDRASRSAVGSFCERRVHDEVDGGRRLVTRHETFSEIAGEVVVGGLRLCLGDVAEAPGHPLFHGETRERCDDTFYLDRRKEIVLQADDIKATTRRTERHLGFFIEA